MLFVLHQWVRKGGNIAFIFSSFCLYSGPLCRFHQKVLHFAFFTLIAFLQSKSLTNHLFIRHMRILHVVEPSGSLICLVSSIVILWFVLQNKRTRRRLCFCIIFCALGVALVILNTLRVFRSRLEIEASPRDSTNTFKIKKSPKQYSKT